MVQATTSWVKENTTLLVFLIGQALMVLGGAAYVLTYMVQLEGRVRSLEDRGSPHLAQINNRLTVTEKDTIAQQARIDRIVEIMLRELPVKKEQLK
jgi:Tfp pilus assembly protein PilO